MVWGQNHWVGVGQKVMHDQGAPAEHGVGETFIPLN